MTKLARFTEFSRKIVAVGRNYSEHAAELGNAVPTKPLLFMKVIFTYFFPIKFCNPDVQPPSAMITAGQQIEIPLGCAEIHHEIELGVIISKQCKRVDKDSAMDYVGGYCLALDMTARDFQVWRIKICKKI